MSQNDGFAATFCEYRYGHIHAGCDMRTFRKTGIPVVAPCDGRITALHGDENGYGLMLTLEGPDGTVYRFAHLSSFESEKLGLSAAVDAEREKTGARFPFDVNVRDGGVRVKKGQVIAYSGDTGIGTPHLHFEVLGSGGSLINPMGLVPAPDAPDPTPPVISSFALIPVDENSTVEGLPLPRSFAFKNEGGRLLASVNATGKVVLEVRAFDENRAQPENSSRMGVYRIEASSGGKPVYGLGFDGFDEKYIRKPEYIYDPLRSRVTGGDFFYRLYDLSEEREKNAFAASPGRGIIEVEPGKSVAVDIDACDYSSNRAGATITINGLATSSVEVAGKPAAKKARARAAREVPAPKKAAAAKKSAASGAASPAGPSVRAEYALCGIILVAEGLPQGSAPLLRYAGGKAVRPMNYAGGRAFFIGYSEVSGNFEFSLEAADKKGGKAFKGSYRLEVTKVSPGAEFGFPGSDRFSFVADGWLDPALPLYAGAPVADRVPAAGDAPEKKAAVPGSATICFSQAVASGRVLYVPKGARGEGIYSATASGKLFFMDNSPETPSKSSRMAASVRYVKSLSVAASADSEPPSIRMTRKSQARLSKKFRYSKTPSCDFVAFALSDARSGISRNGIRYFLDGRPCGNFEFFKGAVLNCYLCDLASGPLRAGEHSIKVTVADRSGNESSFEKKFVVAK